MPLYERQPQQSLCPDLCVFSFDSVQYGERDERLVYPGEESVKVELNGEDVCLGLTASGTECTVIITVDGSYNVSLTLSNDVGSVTTMSEFDCEWFVRCM